MKKIIRITAALMASAITLTFSACGAKPAISDTAAPSLSASVATSASEKKAVSFTDALGREVTVEQPKKVAVVSGSYAEIWLLAGGELAAATEDAWFERDLKLPDSVVKLGAMKTPSVEDMIKQGVDFVLLSSKVSEHVKLLETLEAAKINCGYFEVETFEDYLAMLKICTDITGKPEKYNENGANIKERINAAIERSKGQKAPTVLFLRAFSTGVKAKGSDNMTGRMLKDLGCVNIADSEKGLLEDVSMEKVIAADPDYIFVVTMGESGEKALEALKKGLLSNPAWEGLSAVKNNRYIVLPKELFHYKPNARWGESYEMLADILYDKK